MNNCTNVSHFLQGINSIELKAAVNVGQAQAENYETDFDATMSYLGQMVMKKETSMQSLHIAKTNISP